MDSLTFFSFDTSHLNEGRAMVLLSDNQQRNLLDVAMDEMYPFEVDLQRGRVYDSMNN